MFTRLTTTLAAATLLATGGFGMGQAVGAPATPRPPKPLYQRDHKSADLPAPIVRADGITLPQAAPDGGDILLYDNDPDGIKEKDPKSGKIVAVTETAATATASRLRNPGGGHWETVTCSYGAGTGFYRNYNPTTDDFLDLDYTYHKYDQASIRNEPYRRYGPRGVIAYRNKWGFMSNNCLSG